MTQPVRAAGHSPLSNGVVKNVWSCSSPAQYAFPQSYLRYVQHEFITHDKNAAQSVPKYCLNVKVLWIVTSYSLVEPSLWDVPLPSCAVFSLEPMAQKPRNEIMDLRSVMPYSGSEIGLVESTLSLAVRAVHIVKISFRTGCKVLFRRIIRRGQMVPWRLCVLLVVYWCIVKGQRCIFEHEASHKYLDIFCK